MESVISPRLSGFHMSFTSLLRYVFILVFLIIILVQFYGFQWIKALFLDLQDLQSLSFPVIQPVGLILWLYISFSYTDSTLPCLVSVLIPSKQIRSSEWIWISHLRVKKVKCRFVFLVLYLFDFVIKSVLRPQSMVQSFFPNYEISHSLCVF